MQIGEKNKPCFQTKNKNNYKLPENYRIFSIKVSTHPIHSSFNELREKALPPPKMRREFIHLIAQQLIWRTLDV